MSLLRDQVRKLQDRLEFIEDSNIFHDPDSPSAFGSAHVSHQALITPSSRKPSRESRMQRNTREDTSIPGSVFDCQPARQGIEKSGSTNAFTLVFGKSKGKKSERQKFSLVYGSPCRGYRDLYSKWHDKSESSFLGDASGKIPRPNGSSELDCELPNRGLLEGEESHTRLKVDQGNRSSQIAG